MAEDSLGNQKNYNQWADVFKITNIGNRKKLDIGNSIGLSPR